jgi:hypothetical protein
MEIKQINKGLLPELHSFDDHFVMIEKLEKPSLELFNQAEKSWKEVENFEFQKMDIDASFKNLIKRI